MLLITKGTALQTIIVTLSESKTITAPYYLFVFSLVGGSDVIKFIKHYADDTSDYPDRYNEFSIDETLFDDVPAGQYSYDVYEQESSSNTDPDGLNKVECGKMVLNPAAEITRDGYTTETTIKGYAG